MADRKPRTARIVIGMVAGMAALLLVAGCQGYRDGTSRTVGETTDDVLIQTTLKSALLRDPAIRGLRINTQVHKGVVTLFGRVGSEAERQRVLDITGSVKGVDSVQDRLTIVTE